MARKGENIRKRKDGRWEARYIKGRNADGSIQYGYVYAKKYSEVKSKRNLALQNLEREIGKRKRTGSAFTFNDLLDEWKAEVFHNVKDSSYGFYEIVAEHHLKPYFGDLLIMQLTNDLTQNFVQHKIEENLSASYIHSIMLIFQNVLKSAQKKGMIEISPLYFQIPKVRKKSLEIFTDQEWRVLEKYLKLQIDEFSLGIRLCMYTGLRIGELSGLTWGDINASNGHLSVKRTVYRMKNINYDALHDTARTVLRIGPPKTQTSVREIPLPYFLLEDIQDYRRGDDVFILTGTTKCMEPRNIQKRYKTLLRRCGLRYLNFHSLRHSFATIGIQRGFDYKTLSEILGHASVNTTLNVYVHSNMERKRQCMELLK